MGITSYIILLFNNAETFTKISIILITIILLYASSIIILEYLKIKREIKKLIEIEQLITEKEKNINNLYTKITSLNNKSIFTNIYILGINEFIYMYKKGINDINTIVHAVKEAMEAEILKNKENKYIFKNKLNRLRAVLNHITALYLILGSILLFQKENIIIYQKLNTLNIISILNELLLPIAISIIISLKLKIIENKFANLNFKIYNNHKILLKKFLVILYHKFYE